MWTRGLDGADPSCGGKAHGLARLIAAGLRVPDGFVIDDRAFRVAAGESIDPQGATLDPELGISIELKRAEPDTIGHTLDVAAHRIQKARLPEMLMFEVEGRARELGGPFAVRSSATIEDAAAGAAAGVFSSHTAVSMDELWSAIRAVWTSALTPLAAAYANWRGGEISINVIVQRAVTGDPIVVYTRPPGDRDGNELWIQRAGRIERLARDDARAANALAAERAIGATGGADLELVAPPADTAAAALDGAWLVQARPIVHPKIVESPPPPSDVMACLGDGRTWTWDVAHNPDPLSPAQAGLVERIEREGAAPWSSKLCAGFLYTAPRDDRPPPPARPTGTAALEARVAELEARMAAALGDEETVPLADAIARYVAFFRVWAGELSPLIAVSRGDADANPHRPSAVQSVLLAAARDELDPSAVLERLGRFAPAWDVAAATFAERPAVLWDAIGRARVIVGEASPSPKPTGLDEVAIAAADLTERDDAWFARAQWLVRSAILARAERLKLATEDAFWLPLEELATDVIDPVAAARRASGARAAAARAARWNMPISVGPSSTGKSGVALRGIGIGGSVTGRVVRLRALAETTAVSRGDIVVTRAVTPALAVIVIGCAGIVSETGGPLDHGAAMARELGIPCVVGCRDACTRLTDGMIVTIDGDDVRIDR